jgi:hypothetical protein
VPTIASFATIIDNHLRTAQSKTAFQLINRLSILHPTKIDGGIMLCFLTPTDELVVGQEKVLLSCLKQLQLISGEAAPREICDIDFPTLPPITFDEVTWLQRISS